MFTNGAKFKGLPDIPEVVCPSQFVEAPLDTAAQQAKHGCLFLTHPKTFTDSSLRSAQVPNLSNVLQGFQFYFFERANFGPKIATFGAILTQIWTPYFMEIPTPLLCYMVH